MIIDYDKYRDYDALNYSLLKAVDSDPGTLVVDDKDFSDAMKLGDAVDILMFTPEQFEKKYWVSSASKPTASLLLLADEVAKKGLKDKYDIEALSQQLGLWNTTKDEEKRIAKWDVDIFWDYITEVENSKDKIIITPEENVKINLAVKTLNNHIFTKDIFNTDLRIERQLAIVFEYEGTLFKCLLDLVLFDDKNKIIYPYDLKTTSEGIFGFAKKVFYWRYDIQASLYTHGLESEFPDYEVKDFKDIVYSFVSEKPLVYNLGAYKEKSRDGFIKNDREYTGWLEMAENLIWHQDNKIFDYPKKIYESNGEIVL